MVSVSWLLRVPLGRYQRATQLMVPRTGSLSIPVGPDEFVSRCRASFSVRLGTLRYAFVDEVMRWGSRARPRMEFAGRVRESSDAFRITVCPLLNDARSSANGWWFPTVRPVLRCVVRKQPDEMGTATVEASARINAACRLLFSGSTYAIIAGSSLCVMGSVAGGIAGVGWGILFAGPGTLLLAAGLLFLCLLLASIPGAEVGYAALDDWLREQSE